MNKIKDYNKSIYVDSHLIRNNKLARRHSYDLKKSKIIEEDSNISHNKFKKLAKNKFKNIPKNQKLMNFSTILNNNENKNNNLNIPNINYLSIINDIYKNDSHLEHATNIKKKTNENNLKVSSLIPILKKRFNKSKQRTTNENNNLIINILKKEVKRNSHSKKNLIIYDDKCSKNTKISKHTKNSKNSKKKRKKRFNSSHQLIQIKNDGESNISKQMENIKVKNKKKNKNGENKKKEIDIEKIEDENKDEIMEKKNKKGNKEKQIICINNTKTKNEYEVEKSLNKEKKKKYKRFPFCCLTMKDENSSDEN